MAGIFPFGSTPHVVATFHVTAPAGTVEFRWIVKNPADTVVADFIAGPIVHAGGSFDLPTWAYVVCDPAGDYEVEVRGRMDSDPFVPFATVEVTCQS